METVGNFKLGHQRVFTIVCIKFKGDSSSVVHGPHQPYFPKKRDKVVIRFLLLDSISKS